MYVNYSTDLRVLLRHPVGYLIVAVHHITILAVRRTQPITKSQNFINNPCPIATNWLHGKQQQKM